MFGKYVSPRVVDEILAEPPELGKMLAVKSRGITNKRIKETIYLPQAINPTTESPELHWIALDQLDRITLSGPHRRWVNELLGKKHY